MGKALFIAEKPSVAQEFAKTLGVTGAEDMNGYLETERYIVTWCFGHLVTMSYPEAYDPKLKKWSLDTLPFLPETFRYEMIPGRQSSSGRSAAFFRGMMWTASMSVRTPDAKGNTSTVWWR